MCRKTFFVINKLACNFSLICPILIIRKALYTYLDVWETGLNHQNRHIGHLPILRALGQHNPRAVLEVKHIQLTFNGKGVH
jgi:hypothetical protein